MKAGRQRAGVAHRLHSGRAGWPLAPPACPLAAREGGGRDAALAVMAAVGMRLGRADEGSLPGSWPGARVACIPVERGWPLAPPACRWSARGRGAGGMRA